MATKVSGGDAERIAAQVSNNPDVVQRLARNYAIEYLTGNFRPLREAEVKVVEQLMVVMLAFHASARPHDTHLKEVAAQLAQAQQEIERLKKLLPRGWCRDCGAELDARGGCPNDCHDESYG